MVGAVTILPPAAFSSFTAKANRFTHSMARRGSAECAPFRSASVSESFLNNDGARRLTFRPPGRIPSAEQPLSTHSCMTAQMPSNFSRSSSSERHTSSLASMMSEIDLPSRRQMARSSSAVVKG
ncbi:hypothetical protein D3C73_1158270 [compost metagenome]